MPRLAATVALAVLAAILALPAPAGADPVRGQQIFQRCAACHSAGDDSAKMQGPNLRTVIGRRAGTLPGFDYSSAMTDAGASDGLVWTRETIDKFLLDPDDFVPGTAMNPPFRLDAQERQDVIDYLEQAEKK